MKKLKIILLGLMILGLCSLGWSLDTRASLSRDVSGMLEHGQETQINSRGLIWSQDFNGTQFPPQGWDREDVDGDGTQWARQTGGLAYQGTGGSAGHYFAQGMQEGWLFTPRVAIPDNPSITYLKFMKASLYFEDMDRHDVKIIASNANTAPAASDPGWRPLWSDLNPSSTWTEVVVEIPEDLRGHNVYIAFVYEGDFASLWVVDNVSMYSIDPAYLTLDVYPPGSGTTYPHQGQAAVDANTTIDIAASPGFGYTWNQWDGDDADDLANPAHARTSIYMDDDKSVRANFTPYNLENLFVQDVIGGNAFTSTLDTANGIDYEVAEYFSGPIESIEKVVVHALANTHDGTGWVPWPPDEEEVFTVRFYDQAQNQEPDWDDPIEFTTDGKVFSVGPVWSYTGYKIELELDTPVTLSSGWVSVQRNVDVGGGGWMLLLSSEAGTGDGIHYTRAGTQSEESEHDVCLELWGTKLIAPPAPPVLVYPVNETYLNKYGFNFRWQMGGGGGEPDAYELFIYDDEFAEDDEYIYMSSVIEHSPPLQFNPVKDSMEFEYDKEYFWAVAAIGSEYVMSERKGFRIEPDPTITNFPWDDGFETYADFALDFWPWRQYDGDGLNTYSIQDYNFPNQNYKGSYIIFNPGEVVPPLNSAPPHDGDKFAACFAAIGGANDDWLISPPIEAVDNLVLSFWAKAYTTNYPEEFEILLSTTDNYPESFIINLHDDDSIVPGDDWHQYFFELGDYAGDIVHFAIHCISNDAFFLMLDDFRLEMMGEDEIPPVITHLPLLNTPITDAPYLVVAHIVDDPLWNNPIDYAQLYYSIDEGDNFSDPIPMTHVGDDIYVGEIPAIDDLGLELGTIFVYYLEAADSEGNVNTDQNQYYTFEVDKPVWLEYDVSVTGYVTDPEDPFGVAVEFENPFYGTGKPLWLLGAYGAVLEDEVPTTLVIFEIEGDQWNAIGSGPFEFPEGLTYQGINLMDNEILIESQYFGIGFLNIPPGYHFLFDETFDYGTSYVLLGTTLYNYDVCFLIGAFITDWEEGMEAPDITIFMEDGYPKVTWGAVEGAVTYNVYSSDDPYLPMIQWTREPNMPTEDLFYSDSSGALRKFFRVTASTTEEGDKSASLTVPASVGSLGQAEVKNVKVSSKTNLHLYKNLNKAPKGFLKNNGAAQRAMN